MTRSVGVGGCKEYDVSDELSPDPHFLSSLPTSNWRGGKLPEFYWDYL